MKRLLEDGPNPLESGGEGDYRIIWFLGAALEKYKLLSNPVSLSSFPYSPWDL